MTTMNSLFVPVTSKAAKLAQTALIKEVMLTPKPGLVDQLNTGAHHDMDLQTFIDSINAISPYFDQLYQFGRQNAHLPPEDLLPSLRPIGIACEQAMFSATQKINTHKGGIFAFGLLLASIGRLETQQSPVNHTSICQEVAAICADLVDKELQQTNQSTTSGEKLFKQYKFTGARGEAASGYSTARTIALPIYIDTLKAGYDEETALLQSLLHLMAYNNDTNVVSRGGIEGLEFVQQTAKQLIEQQSLLTHPTKEILINFDNELIKRHISPGGSADLLGITWFLAQYYY